MLSTFSMNPVFRIFTGAGFAAAVMIALIAVPAACAADPVAAIAWHNDLPQALRAAQQSQRPILAIFTASWSTAGTTLERTALASAEAVAVVTACFEPVCVDIDTNPEATRRHGVKRIPTVCVITPQDELLTSFDLPEHPAQFVALAARAAQSAAATAALARSGGPAADRGTDTAPTAGGPSATVSAFGSDIGDSLLATRQPVPTGGADAAGTSVSAVAAKVRKLSDFASGDGDLVAGDGTAMAASYRDQGPAAHPFAAAPADPASIAAIDAVTPPAPIPAGQPVAAPATSAFTTAATVPQAAAPVDSVIHPQSPAAVPQPAVGSVVAGSPLGIEPPPSLPSSPSQGATPWLGMDPRQQSAAAPPTPAPAAAVAANPAPTRPIEPQAAPGGAADPAAAEKPKTTPSTAASFLAALQKPFSLLTRPGQTAKTDAKPAPKSADPAATATTGTTGTASATTVAASAARPDTSPSMPLGLEGYCPVTLAERGAWVEGRAQWGARHRGRTYLFAGVEQQQAFLSDPDRYAPVLSGDDPVLAFDAGRSTPGQRRYGVTYQSRMYLFSSTETRDAFAANPQRYTTGAVVAENRAGTGAGVVR